MLLPPAEGQNGVTRPRRCEGHVREGVERMSIIVKCPTCNTKNRVAEDTNRTPLCGKCNNPLLVRQFVAPVHLTTASFDLFINKSNKPVLVDFWAAWCGPCRQLAPILEKFAESQYSITVAKVDTESNPLLASRFNIFSIPALLLFENGKEVKRISGLMSLEALEEHLKLWIKIN